LKSLLSGGCPGAIVQEVVVQVLYLPFEFVISLLVLRLVAGILVVGSRQHHVELEGEELVDVIHEEVRREAQVMSGPRCRQLLRCNRLAKLRGVPQLPVTLGCQTLEDVVLELLDSGYIVLLDHHPLEILVVLHEDDGGSGGEVCHDGLEGTEGYRALDLVPIEHLQYLVFLARQLEAQELQGLDTHLLSRIVGFRLVG